MHSPTYGQTIADALLAQPDRLPAVSADKLTRFAQAFWQDANEQDLANRAVTTDSALTLQAWEKFASFDPDKPIIEIVDSADRSHSIVNILLLDTPFITDSVLMELTRQDVGLFYLHNVTHLLTDTNPAPPRHDTGNSAPVKATLIYAEVETLERQQASNLVHELTRVLADVDCCVSDYGAMRQKASELANRFSAMGTSEAKEASTFLKWLGDDHFTFLGFRTFDFTNAQVSQVAGSELGYLRNRPQASSRALSTLRQSTRTFLTEPTLLSFSKAGTASRVHRPAYPDYIGVKRFDSDGNVIGEHGFLGLYTSPVYTDRPTSIPILRQKFTTVLERSGYAPNSFDGKALKQILATYPRDELLQMSVDELTDRATTIVHIHERRLTKVFFRPDRYGLFFVCLVYLPRDALNTRVRMNIQNRLVERLNASDVEFDSYFSESVLVRLQYILRVDPTVEIEADLADLERDIEALAKDWYADFYDAAKLHRRHADHDSLFDQLEFSNLKSVFPSDYAEKNTSAEAIEDLNRLLRLKADTPGVFLDPSHQAESKTVQLKLLHRGDVLPLSRVVPVLEHLGFQVISEHPYRVNFRAANQQQSFSIQDFTLACPGRFEIESIAAAFAETFKRVWSGEASSDALNGLVLKRGLSWREVALLRTYSRYMKQAAFGFGQLFISETLLKHETAAGLLIEHFSALHRGADDGAQTRLTLHAYFDSVASLNEDRVLRKLLELIDATLRTNFFATEDTNLFVLKLSANKLSGLPEPKPQFEIFVYSPEVEGVHLRSSSVARGGIRWSDRLEDYRTEVLGLVKAQIVKNAVIVPSGAKGGFVISDNPVDHSPEQWRERGIQGYQKFINGLLSVTDNIIDNEIVPPPSVLRRDSDDPYLVVAADKGTATFSDIANSIALEQGFWLADAFASGGSIGYDHKKMGITARGAWISVQRHFRSLGVDPQREPIDVIGVGDMAGDVFGNGMLSSQSIRLLGAFNHLHIFVDPNPEPAESHIERSRLFKMDRSSWSDYDTKLISAGGGIFERSQKVIRISPQIQQRFDISAAEVTPDQLIQHLLRAQVDLIWNGGIGTYIKASSETHESVGDRANDNLRIDATAIRARVIGEGGNLGVTQLGRIEFASNGGLVNADFIDNAAGVDCSDHEVNLKILLTQALSAGLLKSEERNNTLLEQESEIADIVLANNFIQARCLAIATRHSKGRIDEYNRLVQRLESELAFERSEAAFPTEELLLERSRAQLPLLLPELSTLLGNAKILLKQQLSGSRIPQDKTIRDLIRREFPTALAERFESQLLAHRLSDEIIITLIANEVVGCAGLTFVDRLMEFSGYDAAMVVSAYWACARLFDYPERLEWVDSANVSVAARGDANLALIRFCRRACRWLLRQFGNDLDVSQVIARYEKTLPVLLQDPGQLFLNPSQRQVFTQRCSDFDGHATHLLAPELGFELFNALPVAEVAARTNTDPVKAGQIFRSLGAVLAFDRLTDHLAALPATNHWRSMERDALLDDLCERQVSLACSVLQSTEEIGQWMEQNRTWVDRWRQIVGNLEITEESELAALSMTVRKLADL